MEEIKKKRGRPRKNPEIPEVSEELKSIIEEVQEKQEQIQQQLEELPKEPVHKEGEWDVKIGDPIPYFDKRLSYELTGYRPITETEGLDFNSDWFTEARETFLKTERYCSYYLRLVR